ncbi:MAG: cytochrome c biogenesis protein CcdA [Armatimonadota bacterium]|nr:cytochrome c biogenesis protein CcdA [Armatimonadota bacterium]
MEHLFAQLSRAVEGSPGIALGAAGLWGILSVLLSPCHLASIPLIVGFLSDQGELSVRRAFFLSSAFAAGILLTIAVLGAVTASLGRIAGDVGPAGNYVLAAVFFFVGLYLLDVISFSLPGMGPARSNRRGPWAAFLLGALFGVALGPCTFAYMAPILAASFRLGASRPLYAAALLLMYGVGHCAVIVAAGTSAQGVQRYLNWSRESRGTAILKKVCGVLVLLGGLYLLWTAR